MSFVDWIKHTRQRYRRKSVRAATTESVRELVYGAQARILFLFYNLLGKDKIQTELCGVSCQFYYQTPKDIERAQSLNREEPIAEWLFQDISNGVFWDIGAFHGHYTVLAYLQNMEVVTFEPDLGNRLEILRNLEANISNETFVEAGEGLPAPPSVDIKSFALSDSAGKVQFGGGTADASVVGEGDGNYQVQTYSGDGISGNRPTHVKLDVEGHEIEVLDGMSETLKGIERIAIELHDGVSEAAVKSRLREAGLTVVELPSARSETHLGGYRE